MPDTVLCKPVVMCFSGLDPSGGAGISADIETLFSLGCHPAAVVSALTVQDSRDAQEMQTLPPALLLRQARTVLNDMQVQCFKVGLLGSVATIEAVHGLLQEHANVPVVIDPVLQAGGGFAFARDGSQNDGDSMQDIIAAMGRWLLPRCTVLTPNTDELQQLAGPAANKPGDYWAAAKDLLATGCKHILLTGSHANTEAVVNRLYTAGKDPQSYDWPRLPAQYHGSGCTLAAAVAAYLAQGEDVPTASAKAQAFTFAALENGWQPGRGQYLPERGHGKSRESRESSE